MVRGTRLMGAVLSLLAFTAIAAGCSENSANPEDNLETSSCVATLDSVASEVFAKRCASGGCHAAENPASGLDLASPGVETRLIGVPALDCEGSILVVPGSPRDSLLANKLAVDGVYCGAPMPLTGSMSDKEVRCVFDWISSLTTDSCETCGGEACVDLQADAVNCGTCGESCGAGVACVAGECACGPGKAHCDGACVDTVANARHCGACGAACGPGGRCEARECVCDGALTGCADGCVDALSSAAHCGGCGRACDPGQVCAVGECASGCGALEQCGDSCVDTQTDILNCGMCDDPCAPGQTCVSGKCECPAGGQLCDGKCVDTRTDMNHCGGCGSPCGTGEACADSSCGCASSQQVSFSADVEPLLAGSCTNAGCHAGPVPKAGLSLAAGTSHGELIGVKASQCTDGRMLVAPSSPGGSYILDKLLGTNMCKGSLMPKAGQRLPQAQIATIAAWICSGAPDN